MSKVMVRLTEESFIGGCLRPAGFEVEVDEAELGAKVGSTAKPGEAAPVAPVALTPNLAKVGRGGGDTIEYEVAAISPTGPAPIAPQAVPPGTEQTGADSFVAPADASGTDATVAVVPETTPAPKGRSK